MPVCPRCGKCLSSDQALNYHLNRKYRCGTWKCLKCLTPFDTKFQLRIHEMNCVKGNMDYPSVDTLLTVYNSVPAVILEHNYNTVVSASPQCETVFGSRPDQLIGKPLSVVLAGTSGWTVHPMGSNLVCVVKPL